MNLKKLLTKYIKKESAKELTEAAEKLAQTTKESAKKLAKTTQSSAEQLARTVERSEKRMMWLTVAVIAVGIVHTAVLVTALFFVPGH